MEKEKLGLFATTALVVGNIIGVGVFMLPATMARFGGISIFGWIFTSLGAFFLAMVFYRLSKMLPKVGGPYAYVRSAFGDYMGFQIAWSYWIAIWTGNVATIAGALGYLSIIFPALSSSPWASFLSALTIIWVFTLINLQGVKHVGVAQVLLTFLKAFPLILIALFGLPYFNVESFTPFVAQGETSFSALMGASMMAMWAFIGVESASIPAENIDKPTKTIPRATLLGTLIVVAIYIACSVAITSVIPIPALAASNAPYAEAAKIIFGSSLGSSAATLVALAAVVAALGGLNGWIFLQGQVAYAAAKDGLFPSSFAKISKKGVPSFAIWFTSLISSFLLALNFNKSFVDIFEFMINLAVFASLLTYLYSVMAQLIIQFKTTSEGSVLTPTDIFLSVVAFAYVVWAIMGAGNNLIIIGSMLFFLSTPVYVWLNYKKTA